MLKSQEFKENWSNLNYAFQFQTGFTQIRPHELGWPLQHFILPLQWLSALHALEQRKHWMGLVVGGGHLPGFDSTIMETIILEYGTLKTSFELSIFYWLCYQSARLCKYRPKVLVFVPRCNLLWLAARPQQKSIQRQVLLAFWWNLWTKVTW